MQAGRRRGPWLFWSRQAAHAPARRRGPDPCPSWQRFRQHCRFGRARHPELPGAWRGRASRPASVERPSAGWLIADGNGRHAGDRGRDSRFVRGGFRLRQQFGIAGADLEGRRLFQYAIVFPAAGDGFAVVADTPDRESRRNGPFCSAVRFALVSPSRRAKLTLRGRRRRFLGPRLATASRARFATPSGRLPPRPACSAP